jgi:hypothetical protein
MTTLPVETTIEIDTSGVYDMFLHGLIARMPHAAGPGDIHFVLHEDENKDLFVPRDYGNGRFKFSSGIYVNPTTIENMKSDLEVKKKSGEFSLTEVILEFLMKQASTRAETGHYVIWEDPYKVNLIPTPNTTFKDALNRELERRRAAKGGFG